MANNTIDTSLAEKSITKNRAEHEQAVDPRTLSGLELLTALIDQQVPPPSIADTMGVYLVEVREGYAKFQATASAQHLNPMGGVHGGFACTALDSATGCAVHTMLKPGEGYGTIDINVKMMRPIPVGKTLYAESQVINMSKSLGVSEGKLVDDEGKLYAYASCTCKIIR
ncbi:PaaI family thioesterase [Thalassotalea euphylliae]|uniref:PaaI family thioesterase n=1 Tax=Thalassotalea euphylliae TaxID=1655234 RepID=A0A3E0TU86_9GAMM|nr:PaaI family thioesterase [Thalassotalea euphylliae]REL27475.1 PaaI family thioesterase [Thalassotalea euphylliae]